jgi:nucleotide-binding universal stress UspA family protein
VGHDGFCPSLKVATCDYAGRSDGWEPFSGQYTEVRVSQDIVHGHPGRALVGLSARAALAVLGRHAKHPGLQGPGSVRHAVLSHALGPVAVVPSS